MELLDHATLVTATGGRSHDHVAHSPPFVPSGHAMAAPRWAYVPAYVPDAPTPAMWAGAWWPRRR